ncbi:MAG: phosphodiester glycosidase family protein [Holosporales bacterium]|jgi:exopolysaccharide biosynthesis protein|nr:phosphodiester glycosidase family protein [Holosporales bacterium]
MHINKHTGWLRRYIALASILFFTTFAFSEPTYEVRRSDKHIIHIVTFPTQAFQAHLVKAQDALFGRETVSSCAQRFPTAIAINGGFFEMGENTDGIPSATLILKGEIAGLALKEHFCLVLSENTLKIVPCHGQASVCFGTACVPVTAVNKAARTEDVLLYTSFWGKRTRTPLSGRVEIAFDKNCQRITSENHGNCDIPSGGYVVSLPRDKVPQKGLSTAVLNITLSPHCSLQSKDSCVTGIPPLVLDGKIIPAIYEWKTTFGTARHARTAIGVRANGTIVLVVAEHHSARDVNSFTLGEVRVLLRDKASTLDPPYQTKLNTIPIDQVLKLCREEGTTSGVEGLTLLELAQLMLDLECIEAINLDGGKSSSLYFDGRIVTQKEERPVSDCLIFEKRAS